MDNDFIAKIQAIPEDFDGTHRTRAESEIDALCKVGVSSYDDLLSLLELPNSEQHETACWVFGILGKRSDAFALVKLLQGDNEPVWLEAAKALGALRSKRSIKPLIELTTSTLEVERKKAALYALIWINDMSISELLIEILKNLDEDPHIRGIAAEGLSYLFCCGADKRKREYKQAFTALTLVLEDSSSVVRFWAAFALGNIRDKKALPELEKLVESDNAMYPGWWTVQEEASDAITRIKGGTPPDRVPLFKALLET